MLGFNGGLLGKRRVPTTAAATGLWFPNEQSIAQAAQIWPPFLISDLGPVLWYDFSDAATVTVASSQITSITDKGSRGWTLTKSTTGPAQATWTNNALTCCDWGSASHSNYLRNTSTTSTSIADIFIVLDAAFGSTFPTYNGLISGTSDPVNLAGSSGAAGMFAGSFNQAFLNGSATNSYSAVLPTINSPALMRVKNSNGSAVTLTNGFQIGMDRANSGRGWYGLIAEVVCFSSVLSDVNANNVKYALASKWSLTVA
jgi:hypothetical protein